MIVYTLNNYINHIIFIAFSFASIAFKWSCVITFEGAP